MARRLVEASLALIGLIALSPVLLIAAIGIRLSSPGPILYRASRVGLNGRLFSMYKFRTMRSDRPILTSRITANQDPRTFRFGGLLRRFKIDELPQLVNIVKGDMSFVGPRPEDPAIVANHYTAEQLETLRVRPGLASPGSIYYYTHQERQLNNSDPETSYVKDILPHKLALELVYVREASLFYDIRIALRTLWVILCVLAGRTAFSDPAEAKRLQC